MSTFSGLSTALSSLIAQRQALEVSGQNIANAKTVGYTRQRADLTSVEALSAPTLFSTGSGVGVGTQVSGITRMGDMFLDARLRSQTSSATFQAAQATALSRLESTLTEPADTGVAASLQTYWDGWQAVANNPGDTAARTVLLGNADALTSQISSGYRAVESQWNQLRTEASTLVTQVNTRSSAIADLNSQIRSILVSGGSANELIDQRSVMVTELSGLVGATARQRDDGTLDVMVAGNALVRGVRSEAIAVQGAATMAGGIGEPPVVLDPTRLVWADGGTPLTLEGGRVASHIATLSPTGPLASAIGTWNSLATNLATSVNTLHQAGQNRAVPPVTGTDFFALAAGVPAALGLSVAITDPADVAAADPTKGALDGSWADQISQLATAAGGPDEQWQAFVVDLGVRTSAATQRATVLEAARSTAENLQNSQASVDLDEESVNMLAYQRAYEGAARVLTAMDEMLDQLINRTGVVGR